MIELVLAPEDGQLAVHTPFLIRRGEEVSLFYAKCDYPPGKRTLGFRKKYEIFRATSSDGNTWRRGLAPVLSLKTSVCRPWVLEDGAGGYRMILVTAKSEKDTRLLLAESSDLVHWTLKGKHLFEAFDGYDHLASPCVVKAGGKVRLFFSGSTMHKKGDRIFLAESTDGATFAVDRAPKYVPQSGTGYDEGCYTPFVFQDGRRWKMLFSGVGADGRYRTFLAEGNDGLSFGPGRVVLDLSGDARFAGGAYKAVLFEDWVYFVGMDGNGRCSIYRVQQTALGM